MADAPGPLLDPAYWGPLPCGTTVRAKLDNFAAQAVPSPIRLLEVPSPQFPAACLRECLVALAASRFSALDTS